MRNSFGLADGMKRLLWFISVLFSVYAQAQPMNGFHAGARFAIGESTITGSGLNVRPKLAVAAGVASNYQFNRYLSLNADFLLALTGAQFSGSTKLQGFFGTEQHYNYMEQYDLVNVEVPVSGQVGYWFGNFLVKAMAGPAVNFNLLALQSRAYEDTDYNNNYGYINSRLDNMNNVSFQMMYGVGAGALARNGQLYTLDLRINTGLSPIGVINNSNVYAYYYALGAGFTF